MSISRGGDYRRSNPVSIGEPEKVTSWPFKEPEKTSAWENEKDPVVQKDAPVRLVDSELEAAQRRTAEIKKLMSPPGALGLPDLLEAARLKWGIPDNAFATQAIFDRIHIFPIDIEDEQKEAVGTGLIHRTQTEKRRDLQNGHRGILISMGLTAADQCISHGVELGHIVRTIRNAPHAQECARILGLPMFFLVMRAGDLTGSETQRTLLNEGKATITDVGGEHSYCYEIDGRKKRGGFVRDNW